MVKMVKMVKKSDGKKLTIYAFCLTIYAFFTILRATMTDLFFELLRLIQDVFLHHQDDNGGGENA